MLYPLGADGNCTTCGHAPDRPYYNWHNAERCADPCHGPLDYSLVFSLADRREMRDANDSMTQGAWLAVELLP